MVAAPGHIITGSTAAAAANVQAQAQAQLALMDKVDSGQKVPPDQDVIGYQDADPQQRLALRQQYLQQIAANPAANIAATGKSIGETIATPGDWVTTQGEKITPPAGYEDALTNKIGKTIGALPVYAASIWAGGLPALVGVAGAQTYTQEYASQVKAGVAPEDAATNAGLKALADGGLMAVPVARWAETLTGVAKRAWVLAATRMAADGVVMTSVSQAQTLVNNVIDQATTQPDKNLLQGVGDPGDLLVQTLAGMVPGGIGLVVKGVKAGISRARSAGEPGGEAEAPATVAQGAQPGDASGGTWQPESAPGYKAGAPAGVPETPPPTAPTPDPDKVQGGIATPPSADQGGTLVRATDSSGNNWIGHSGVLVNEGRNPDVDATFRQAEQTLPATTKDLSDTKPIDDLVTSAHVNATQGITWTGTTEAPDGRAIVEGHDAAGRGVELPEERYAVLAQYGDPARDMYMASRVGEPPIVAVRDPQTQTVLAIAQGRPPVMEPTLKGTNTNFEQQDQAVKASGPTALPAEGQQEAPAAGVETLPQQLLMKARDSGGDLSTSSLAPAERTMLENAGIHPDEAGNYPTTQLYDEADRRAAEGTWDAKMSLAQEDAGTLAARGVSSQRVGNVPLSRRQVNVSTAPNITDRPSLYRQAFRDAGYDPDIMVNQPITTQRDVLAKHLENTFGFKVKIDPRMQPNKAVDSMLDAYRNMQWMAHALGYPLKAMSFSGKVTLSLEPWATKSPYFGLYTGADRAIHMPDRSNSFAHEFTHALDHELLNKLMVDPTARGMLLTSRTRQGALDPSALRPGSSEEAFANVMRAIFHDQAAEAARIADLNMKAQGQGAASRSAAAEAQRLVAGVKARQPIEGTEFLKGARSSWNPRYHAMPEELLARAHEAYVAHTVENAGGGNEFITKGDANYLEQSGRRFMELYPQGEDRDNIFRAFQDLHGALQRENVLGHGSAAQRPGDYDILDPIHWRRIGDPQADPNGTAGLRRAVTRSTTWRQRQLEAIAERAGIKPGQQRYASRKDQLKAAVLTPKDAITPLIHTNMGQLDVYRERYENAGNHPAARVLDNILDKLGYRYGEGRLQGTPFERLGNHITNEAVNKVDRIMNNNGMPTSRLNAETEEQLWNALRGRDPTTGQIPDVPPNVQRAAGEIRAVLTDMHYQAERSGINIGFARDEGYVPIVLDDHKILADGQKAHDTLNQAMHADFGAKQRQTNNTFIHDAYNDLPRRALPKEVHEDMSELARVQEAMRNETDPAKLSQLDQEQRAILDRVETPVREEWANQRADQMHYAINDVPWVDKGGSRAGSAPSPLHSRVLSAEARDVLSPYMVKTPSELLPYYLHSMGRKIAFARTFGPNAEVLVKTMRDLMDAGVPQNERIEIESSIRSSLGLMRQNEITAGHRFGVKARALATMALMGRSAWSTIGEPMVVTAQTNSVGAGLHSFGVSLRALMHELNAPGFRSNDRAEHLADIANTMGIVSTRLQEAMLVGRTEAHSWAPGRVMANFYRRVGLTQITNANKIGAISAAHSAMKIWGRQILNDRRGALFDPRGEYRELGIPNAEHSAFAQWVTNLDRVPTLDEIQNTPMGQRWGEAIRRFIEKTVLEPTAAEKPRGANSALGRFIYGLMSYNFAFQRAVLNPAFNRMGKTIAYQQGRYGKVAGTVLGGAQWAAYATSVIGALMAVQLPVTMLRQEIFDHDRAERWRQDGTYLPNITGLAFQRTGMGGVADPLINAINGLRYEHDLSSLAMGAQLNFYMQALRDIAGSIAPGAGSTDTNTSAYRAWRGFYQLTVMPAAALGTALLKGGPYASFFISMVGQYLTSMSAADKFAAMIEGPKGTKTNLTQEQQDAEQEKEANEAIQRQYQLVPPEGAQAQGGGMPSAGLLGMLDDFAVPIGKYASRFIR